MPLLKNPNGNYTSVCRLCGKQSKPIPALDLPIFGAPGRRLADLQGALMKHLGKEHEDKFKEGSSLLDETLAFMVFSQFEHEDPSIAPYAEALRAKVFAKVRKNIVPDEMIDDGVARLGLDPQDEDNVKRLMKGLRDACCEFGDYAPDRVQSTTSALVHTV